MIVLRLKVFNVVVMENVSYLYFVLFYITFLQVFAM